MEQKELNAILKLLEDPDDVVFKHIEKRLLSEGEIVIPHLENTWENSLDELVHQRAENIINKIQFDITLYNFKTWVGEKSDDLLKGSYLVSRIQYPSLDLQKLYLKIDKIKKSISLELRDNFTPLEQVRVLNQVIFQIYKFTGNNTDFYSPQNSFISDVLDTKKGNPISLAIVYLILARRLGLSIYGVNLPKNFILAYLSESANVSDLGSLDEDKDVLFYINPFNRGAVLGKKEIDYFLKQQKIKPDKSFYVPCDNNTIIQRLILNLVFSYQKLGYPDKISDLEKLLNVFDFRLGENNEQYFD